MRKSAAHPATTVFTFAQRADITITSHTADLLTELLMRKEALQRKLQDKEFRQDLVDYAMLGIMSVAAGTLFSLVTTYLR